MKKELKIELSSIPLGDIDNYMHNISIINKNLIHTQ